MFIKGVTKKYPAIKFIEHVIVVLVVIRALALGIISFLVAAM
jgi:hypothetical protein